jgi:hypothetical protein
MGGSQFFEILAPSAEEGKLPSGQQIFKKESGWLCPPRSGIAISLWEREREFLSRWEVIRCH